MATIYSDQHRLLRELLAMAGKTEDATLLIPDLQRPYIWSPSQVVNLIDSLIRGWPFGTLLTWKVRPDDPARALARSFWKVVDRTEAEDGQPISMKHPPAAFHMVLDGQQRVQSLLLALGGDGWGFKLLDRQWHEHLNGIKPRGPRGQPHWSLGCLCVDITALTKAYAQTKRATAIDYNAVLRWVITDDGTGQSSLPKPPNYKEPLEKSSTHAGRFVRLARLWEAAPDQAGIDHYEAEEIADKLLLEHGAPQTVREACRRSTGALLMVLKDVKQTRVTYLELAEYEEALGSREIYNDAVVNIFTRLNTAGRTLTPEDIKFAWFKVGWKTECTNNQSARACIDHLTEQLAELQLPISVEDVVSAISLVWSVSFNAGKLLTNDDLMKGDAIRPMAANVSENWSQVEEAATRVCGQVLERGLRFREHYQSVNALAYLWAWCFEALQWAAGRNFKELQKDSFDKILEQTLDQLIDRWLVCSHWAGVWTSAESLPSFAARLAVCSQSIASVSDAANALGVLKQQVETELTSFEQAAVNAVNAMNADSRQEVRGYYTALWLWNRLERDRWTKAQVALRQKSRRQIRLEVDHIVPCSLWDKKIAALKEQSQLDENYANELAAAVNELGNCMLLEKNFNVSKSDKPLKEFFEGVHEFKEHVFTIESWASALDLKIPQVDSAGSAVEVLRALFSERTQKIRNDLEQFIRGAKARVDLDPAIRTVPGSG